MTRIRLITLVLLVLARCAAADSPPTLLANSSGSLLAMEARPNAEVTAPRGALTQITYEQPNQSGSKLYDAAEQAQSTEPAQWREAAPAYDSAFGATERLLAQFDSFSPSPVSPNGDIDEVGFLAEDVAPVPEPSTWLAGLLASAGVVVFQRRRFTGRPLCR